MTFLEVFQSFILPAAGVVGGFTALIIFIASTPKRKAEIKQINAEGDKVIQLTAAELHAMTISAAKQALEAQKGLIDNLQEEIKEFRVIVTDLECKLGERDLKVSELEKKVDRLEHELGVREENIETLKQKLQEYQDENKRYKAENEILRAKVEAQEQRIKELEDELDMIRKQFQQERCND